MVVILLMLCVLLLSMVIVQARTIRALYDVIEGHKQSIKMYKEMGEEKWDKERKTRFDIN